MRPAEFGKIVMHAFFFLAENLWIGGRPGDPEILRSSSFHMVRKNPVLNGLLASIHTWRVSQLRSYFALSIGSKTVQQAALGGNTYTTLSLPPWSGLKLYSTLHHCLHVSHLHHCAAATGIHPFLFLFLHFVHHAATIGTCHRTTGPWLQAWKTQGLTLLVEALLAFEILCQLQKCRQSQPIDDASPDFFSASPVGSPHTWNRSLDFPGAFVDPSCWNLHPNEALWTSPSKETFEDAF